MFYTLSEPPGDLKTMNTTKTIYRKWCTAGSSDPGFSAPEARMTAARHTYSLAFYIVPMYVSLLWILMFLSYFW